MIIVRDMQDIDTIERRIKQGDVLDIYNVPYDISKIYFVYNGILMSCHNDISDGGYCQRGEFHCDLRVALLDPARYFIKLVTDVRTEVVIAEEGAEI